MRKIIKYFFHPCLMLFVFGCEPDPYPQPPLEGYKKYFGGLYEEYAYGATSSFDGGAVIVGFTTTFTTNGNWNAWVVKTDADGNGKWAHQYGLEGRETFYSATQTIGKQYVFAGYTTSYSRKEDFYIVKVNDGGAVIWEKAFGGDDNDAAFDIITTSDGNLAVTGYTYSYGLGGRDMWVMKISQSGEIIWDVNFGKYYNDMGYAIKETSDGGFIVVGYTDIYSKEYTYMWLVRLDSNGKFLWEKTIDYDGFSIATDVITHDDGSFTIGGQTDSLKNGGLDFWAIKTDFIGNIIWSNIYRSSSSNTWKLVPESDGGFSALGTTTHMNQRKEDFLLIHCDINGRVIWSQTYGGSNFEIGGKLINIGNDGGYGLTGTTKSYGNGITDFFLVVTDNKGNW